MLLTRKALAGAGVAAMAMIVAAGALIDSPLGPLLLGIRVEFYLFALTLLIYGLATGASALATGLVMLIVLRFIIGLGLGAELPVASTLVSEYAPRSIRGRIVVILEAFWALGWIAAALIGFGTDRGVVAAADDWDEPMRLKDIVPARQDSYERVFRETGKPRTLTDLRENREVRDVLSEPRLERAIGVVGVGRRCHPGQGRRGVLRNPDHLIAALAPAGAGRGLCIAVAQGRLEADGVAGTAAVAGPDELMPTGIAHAGRTRAHAGATAVVGIVGAVDLAILHLDHQQQVTGLDVANGAAGVARAQGHLGGTCRHGAATRVVGVDYATDGATAIVAGKAAHRLGMGGGRQDNQSEQEQACCSKIAMNH